MNNQFDMIRGNKGDRNFETFSGEMPQAPNFQPNSKPLI